MNAVDDLFRAGSLQEAIRQQIEVVKARPTEPDPRYVLAGLLAFAGDLERAATHIDALAAQNPALQQGALMYRNCLAAETERRRVHGGAGAPLMSPDSPATLEDRVRAVGCLLKGDFAAGEQVLASARTSEPPLTASVDGRQVTALRDYDDVLGPVLEIFAGGRCLWLPFAMVRKLEIKEPASLLDLLWAQARLEDSSGHTAEVHLPVLYEGSARHEDEQVKLGRKTEWVDVGGVAFRGLGQRVLLCQPPDGEAEEIGLLSIRSIELSASAHGGR